MTRPHAPPGPAVDPRPPRRRAPRGRHAGTVAALLALAGAPAAGRAQPQPPGPAAAPRVRVGVRPDTVTVGDPFVVVIRVEAPPGATVAFPEGPDSAATVALLDPRRVAAAGATPGGAVDETATYRMAAWDVGAQPVPLGDVVVRLDGVERRVPLGGLGVFVRSVLPADSAERVPKPPRAPLADAAPWWVRYWPWALLAAALLLLLAWAVRRWLRRRGATPQEDAYRTAVAEFERLSRMGLLEAGERGRFVALAVEVLRDYAAARLAGAPTSLTSSELLRAVGQHPDVPGERLARLLEHADLVKFAALPVATDDARAAGLEARTIVDEIERRVREREKREVEEAAARTRAAREAARRYEEERRRAA